MLKRRLKSFEPGTANAEAAQLEYLESCRQMQNSQVFGADKSDFKLDFYARWFMMFSWLSKSLLLFKHYELF